MSNYELELIFKNRFIILISTSDQSRLAEFHHINHLIMGISGSDMFFGFFINEGFEKFNALIVVFLSQEVLVF